MSERVGLKTLVERALFRWTDSTLEAPKDRIHLEEYGDLSLSGELLRMCGVGLIVSTWWKLSYTLKEDLGYSSPDDFGWIDSVDYDEYDWEGKTFWRAIDQTSRLDDFLFTLEGDRNSAPLARACRDDLALLNVLADWCEDHDRPVAAAEARHLSALVVSILRE